MTAGAARNAVRRTKNGDGSDAVGVGVWTDGAVPLELGAATARDDEDSRR
jgi:hypothetical protein